MRSGLRSNGDLEAESIWSKLGQLIAGIRWHWTASPFELSRNYRLEELLEEAKREVDSLGLRTGNEDRLEGFTRVCQHIENSEMSPGALLLSEYLEDGIGMQLGVVVPRTYFVGMYEDCMTGSYENVKIMTASMLRYAPIFDQLISLESPEFYTRALWEAPHSEESIFIIPAWRPVPELRSSLLRESVINPYVRAARVSFVGYKAESRIEVFEEPTGESGFDRDVGGIAKDVPALVLDADEVQARTVNLAGGFQTVIDVDGDFLRTAVPTPTGKTEVSSIGVEEIELGSLLVLRADSSDSKVIWEKLRKLLGAHCEEDLSAQAKWKNLLRQQLQRHGVDWVQKKLFAAGMRTIPRAEAWSLATTWGPRFAADFELLLHWLGLDASAYVQSRDRIRSAHSRATHEIRAELESTLGAVDYKLIESRGWLITETIDSGGASIFVGEVTSISDRPIRMKRHRVRVLTNVEERKWLE